MLRVGDKVDPEGYHLMAKISYSGGGGYVLVVHNHSTHYLILSHDPELHEEGETRFEMSVRYSSMVGHDPEPEPVGFDILQDKYEKTLAAACLIAVNR